MTRPALHRWLKILFFALVARPVVLVLLGLHVVNRGGLPRRGPAIIAANHNSHLDTIVLMSLIPLGDLHRVRPIAAADYFMQNRIVAWFALNVLGIIPIQRSGFRDLDVLFAESRRALDAGSILIIFPEGSRGRPERMGKLHRGLYYLVEDRESIPIVPVVIRGLGRALPRGEALFVPFNCDVVIGSSISPGNDSHQFVENLAARYTQLFEKCLTCAGDPDDD